MLKIEKRWLPKRWIEGLGIKGQGEERAVTAARD